MSHLERNDLNMTYHGAQNKNSIKAQILPNSTYI
ncbi:hypothetical protein T07_11793 [Trichinella nelsoni]|uniref:Uncharacterized protein n=1 Tax=Trichinella nelsoni TaxID=6336 RepID=A0A0V0RAB5_9BILA|nr:hypothetical protein T07_11793 [Trichinella nelsoni]